MARLFQLETSCCGSLQKKQVKDTLPFPCLDHHQWFIQGHAFLHYPSPSTSPILPISCTSSNTQPELKARNRRNAKSPMKDTQLRKELQSFLSSQGLPLDEVPSTKELSNRGRDDLAKVVRRRGYKAVQALLVNSESKPGAAVEDNEIYTIRANDVSSAVTNSISLKKDQLLKNFGTPEDTGQTLESNLGSISSSQAGAKSEGAPGATINSNGKPIVSQGEEELRRRAAEFVRTGRLPDQLTDSDGGEDEDDKELFEDSSDEEEIVNMQNEERNIAGMAAEKAAKLQTKLVPFLRGMAPGELSRQVTESFLSSSQGSKSLEEINQGILDVQRDATLAADFEIQEIKAALISKERDLREVSRDLEETKAQLALIQAKATAEVAQAKQLALEKEIRLKSADLALANLKRVQVEYWGEGERVELAGSFNGWKYFILMESDPTSEISRPDGSRGPMMWGAELWLYPGVYEIKFIIDGVWQIDQRREVVTKNSLHNNLLRVEP